MTAVLCAQFFVLTFRQSYQSVGRSLQRMSRYACRSYIPRLNTTNIAHLAVIFLH